MSGWLHEHLERASLDLLRSMVRSFAKALMSADAAYGERSDERTNTRNGYRHREWDARAVPIDLHVLKLRQGSYFPGWLLDAAAGPRLPWSRWWPRPTCWPAHGRGAAPSSARDVRVVERIVTPYESLRVSSPG